MLINRFDGVRTIGDYPSAKRSLQRAMPRWDILRVRKPIASS